MRLKIEFVLLALLGLTLIFVAGYTQWVSADLTQHSIAQYVIEDLETWPWWTIVGIPFLAGLAYLIAAVVGARWCPKGTAAVRFFIGCEALAIVLLAIGGIGFLAAIFCGLILLYVYLKYRKDPRPSPSNR